MTMIEPTRSIQARAVSRFGFATPQEATWTCDVCGETPQPRWLQAINRYMKSSCACQRAKFAQQHEEERQAEKRAREAQRRRLIYGWLGHEFSCEDLGEKTFSNFEVLRQPAAYQMVLEFADIMIGTLILHSEGYGTGKTHLLAALCQELSTRERSTRCLFATAPMLFKAISRRIAQKEDYTDLLQKAITTPLLVLDDVDKAKLSEFREEIYFDIIDGRVNAHRPIALSTNRLDELAKYVGPASASRLSIGQIPVVLTGRDYRLEL